MSKDILSRVLFCWLIIEISFLAGCGPSVKEYVTRDESFIFGQKDITVCVGIVNEDTWILGQNNILEKELFEIAEGLLKQNGFVISNNTDDSEYAFILTFSTEIGHAPVTSSTTMRTEVDVYGGGGLTQVPHTNVHGGGTYHAIIVSGACFDCKTGKQIFYERTSTTMMNLDKWLGYDVEDMYREPVKKILLNFVKNS